MAEVDGVMNMQEKNLIIETILIRASEQLGDVTKPVMAVYYERFPEARELFAHHGSHRLCGLEGEMVQQALYCLMSWFESTGDVEVMLWGSVPHHNDTLHVCPEYYQGLLTATIDVIESTISTENKQELEVWKELCDGLADLICQSSQYIVGGPAKVIA